MPKRAPISTEQRLSVVRSLELGTGRNATARAHTLSPGTITKIARQHGITFTNARTAAATEARRIDLAARRQARERELLQQQVTALTAGNHRRANRIERQLYDLQRFHNREPI